MIVISSEPCDEKSIQAAYYRYGRLFAKQQRVGFLPGVEMTWVVIVRIEGGATTAVISTEPCDESDCFDGQV